ncbi:MAG TPA: hypothetical protein IAA00_08040 [Candidatus Blautia ornithocaccae]|nr:hypothetical protein [Candidatus Blautia ornithocaccae]
MKECMWIKEKGFVQRIDLNSELLQRFLGDFLFLAYGTNYFQAGHANEKELGMLNQEKLLELRIFSQNQEIYFSRSCIGEEFQWRIASEQDVSQEYYMVQYQTLDINRDKIKKAGNPKDPYGNSVLYTTVGGTYALPAEVNADSSEIICYLIYDKNGMAKIADYRLKGFAERNSAGRGSEKA